MQLLRTNPPLSGTDVPSRVHTPSDAPTIAQTAAKWVGIALDPRPAAKLLGRAGAAATVVALQARGAAATLYGTHTLQSPNTGSHYALRAAADEDKKYADRLVNNCHAVPYGAVTYNGGGTANWHQIANWGNTLLLREFNATAPGDGPFEDCLKHEGGVQSHAKGRVAGIIVGSVLGAALLGSLAFVGVRHCMKRKDAPKLDVEMGSLPPNPAST